MADDSTPPTSTPEEDRCICGETYGPEDCPVHEDDETPGCDCTSLCSMGPTCPGGMLARLSGSGCSGYIVAGPAFCRPCVLAGAPGATVPCPIHERATRA